MKKSAITFATTLLIFLLLMKKVAVLLICSAVLEAEEIKDAQSTLKKNL